MKNYYKKDEVASSCKQMLYCGDQFERRCNKFTYKQFKNKIELMLFISLALSLIGCENYIFVRGMLIDSNELENVKFVTTHMPGILFDTFTSEGKEKSLNKLDKSSTPTLHNDPCKNETIGDKMHTDGNLIYSEYSTTHMPEILFDTFTSEGKDKSLHKLDNSSTSTLKGEPYKNETIGDRTNAPEILFHTYTSEGKEKSLNKFDKISTPTPERESYKNDGIGDSNFDFTAALFVETIKNSTIKHLKPLLTLENFTVLSEPEIRNKFSADINSEDKEKSALFTETIQNSTVKYLEPLISLENINELKIDHKISTPTPDGQFYKNETIGDRNVDSSAALFTETIKNSTIKHLEPLLTLKYLSELSEPEIGNKFSPDIISEGKEAFKNSTVKYLEPLISLDNLNELKIVNKFSSDIISDDQEKLLNELDRISTPTEEKESYKKVGDKNIEFQSNIDFTEILLKETIQNLSGKNSEPLDTLEKLNELSAPEIGKHFSENAFSNKDKFRPPQREIQKIYEANYPAKNILKQNGCNENFTKAENNFAQNCGDSVFEVNATKNNFDIFENNSNKTLKSLLNTQTFEDLSVKFNDSKMVKFLPKMTNVLPNITTETYPALSFDSIEFVTQNYNNNYSDILSVDLHETISKKPNNSEIDVLNIKDYPKSYFEQVSEEVENTNTSCANDEFEHVVKKKVLVQQNVNDETFVITYPVSQNDERNVIQLTFTEASENVSNNTMYTNKNNTRNIESENITDYKSIESSEQNISKAEINETMKKNQNIVEYESKQYPEQDNFVKSFKNIPKESDNIGDNRKDDVGELWRSKERTWNEMDNNNSVKQETGQYNQTDKHNPSIGIDKFENNTYIFNQKENEQLITKIEKNIYQEVTSKSVKKLYESERSERNISVIEFPETDNTLIFQKKKTVQSDLTEHLKNSTPISEQLIPLPFDEVAATLFEAYPPQDVGQTFNDNLADESAGVGKALPVSIAEGSNRSTVIIVMSSATAVLFILISVTIFLISFQRQHGTLDIEMQERNCGKDDLGDEDAQTFAKLLEVELPLSVAVALDECEECL